MTTSRFGRIDRRQFVASSVVGGAAILTAGHLAQAGPGTRQSAASLAQGGGGSVPMFRGNAARTGEMPGPPPPHDQRVAIRWQHPTEPGGTSSAAVVGGVVYTRGTQGWFQALTLAEGRILWRFQASDVITGDPAVADGSVFIGSRDGQFYALDATSGEERWRFTTDWPLGPPVVADGVVLVHAGTQSEGELFALDATSGSELWRTPFVDYSMVAPAVANGKVFVGSFFGVHAIDLATGQELWRVPPAENLYTGCAVANDLVYVSEFDFLRALDAETGDEHWRTPPGQFTGGSFCLSADTVFVASWEFHTVVALNALDGSSRWLYYLDGYPPDPEQPSRHGFWEPSVASDSVFVTRGFGSLYALDTTTGNVRWTFDLPSTGKDVTSIPVVTEGVVLLGSQDGYLYCLAAP